jgi:hypothetical protein
MEPTNPWKKKNGIDASTRNNNENSNSTITSSHLLASNYVPNNLRAINTASVSAYIPTQASPSMKDEIERVFCGLVGDNAPYKTPGNGMTTHAHFDHPPSAAKMDQYNKYQERRNNRPKATINEASFADGQARKPLAALAPVSSYISSTKYLDGTTTNASDNRSVLVDFAAAAAAAKKVPYIGNGMVLGAMDETGTTQHYLVVFRELMQVEHAELQRLYVKAYDNYKIKITTPSAHSTQGGMRNNGVAQLRVMGIADGCPSIKPGDTVLIRPHNPIYLPKRNFSLKLQNEYSGSQMVEVVARVLAVNRGKENKKGNPKKDAVLISWVEDPFLDMHLKKQLCTVRFIPASAAHERCLTALNWLKTINPFVARDLLFPTRPPKLPPPPAIAESNTDADTTEEREYEKLNTNQAQFVQMVTARTAYPTKGRVRPPMILTGPAGTGKTKTLLATILQILRMDQKQRLQRNQKEKSTSNESKPLRSRILICTPSHTACDVITERIVNLLSEEQQKEYNHGNLNGSRNQVRKMVFRLYNATRAIESVPAQILPYTRQGGDGGQFVMPDTQELLNFSVIVCTCHDAHILYLAGLTNSSLRRRRACLQSDIERRLRESGLELWGTIEGCSSPHFTHLFIDEAAQATEPECLIPLSVVVDDDPGAIKVEIALCGDPRQLGPCIYSPNALEGLQRSLLERLLRLPVDTYGGGRDHLMGPHTADSRLTLDEMIEYSFQKTDYRQHLSVFLNLSYRGHPSFLFMPSKLFYFDKLKSIVCKNDSDNIWIKAVRKIESLSENAYPESRASKQMDWPVVFRGVKGKCTSMAINSYFGSNCWCNHEEARVLVEMIKEVIEAGISTASIGVMAAFRAQVVLIRRLLRANKLGNVNVGMVEDYQSMERHVIILSLTRTNKSLMQADVTSGEGLFRQPKRMNVALTRAERVIVVVGEPNIMREDNAWAQWLGFCKDNGLWYGEKGEEKSDNMD